MAGRVDVELNLIRGDIVRQYRKISKALEGQSKRIQDAMNKMERRSSKAFKGMGQNAIGFRTVLAGLAAFMTGRFIRAIGKAGSEVEDLSIQFKVLLGSAEASAKMMKELEVFAQRTPFTLSDLATGTRTMLAFGVEADQVTEYLKQLGDISLGDSQRMKQLTLAFSQVQAAGRLMGQDLLQLINAGFNPLQEISKKTGESMLQLKKRMEDGRISADEVSAAFKAATSEGGRFHNGMLEASKTVSGLSSTIKDQLAASVRQVLAGGIWDRVKDAMGGAVQQLDRALKSGTFEKVGRSLVKLSEHFDTIVKIGAIFFGTFAVAKLKAITIAVAGFLKTLIASNPPLAAMLATLTALELIFAKLDARTAEMAKGIVDFTPDVKSAERLIDAMASLQAAQDALNASGQNYRVQRLAAVDKELKKIEEMTNKHFAKQLADGERTAQGVINVARARITALKALVAEPDKDKKKKDPKAPPVIGAPSPENLKKAQDAYNIMQELNVAAFEAAGQLRNAEFVKEVEWYNKRREALEGDHQAQQFLKSVHEERMEAISQKYRDIEMDKAEKDRQKRISDAQREAAVIASAKRKMVDDVVYTLNVLSEKNEAWAAAAKAAAIVQVSIDTYLGAQKAYTALAGIPIVGPGLGAAAATAATIAGLARVSKIQGFADGGIVSSRQLAQVGERGPEAIIPLKNGAVPVRIEGDGAGTTIINNYYGGGDSSGFPETDQERMMRFAETQRETESLV